jgi:chemotaxis protein MotB
MTQTRSNPPARRIGAMIALLVSSIAAFGLGGCNNQNKRQTELTLASLQEENQQLREENERAAQALQDAQARVGELESENSTLRTATTAQPAQATGGFTRDRVITVAGDVLFDSGSATLKPAGRRELDRIARELISQYSGSRIEIAGFTDPTPLRKTKDKWIDNEGLSAARALAVERYLNSKGVPGDRTHSAAYGASYPKSSHRESRRVEIRILAN